MPKIIDSRRPEPKVSIKSLGISEFSKISKINSDKESIYKNQFIDNDRLGVRAVSSGNGYLYYFNTEYIYGEDSQTFNGDAYIPETGIDDLKITSYYPYTSDIIEDSKFIIDLLKNPTADILSHDSDDPIIASMRDPDVNIRYHHKLSAVDISIVNEDSGDPITDAKVTLENVPVRCKFNITTMNLEDYEYGNLDVDYVNGIHSLIPEEELKDDQFLVVSWNDNEYKYSLDEFYSEFLENYLYDIEVIIPSNLSTIKTNGTSARLVINGHEIDFKRN